MAVNVQRKVVKIPEPIVNVILSGPGGRSIVIRPLSTDEGGTSHMRTVECNDKYGRVAKWAATLGDLRTFGQACIDIADGK